MQEAKEAILKCEAEYEQKLALNRQKRQHIHDDARQKSEKAIQELKKASESLCSVYKTKREDDLESQYEKFDQELEREKEILQKRYDERREIIIAAMREWVMSNGNR